MSGACLRGMEYFALRRDLLLPTVAKVGKSTGRNLRFLHLPARYAWYRIENAYHTITGNYLFRVVKRIVSSPVSLPLASTPNNAPASTVDDISGSGARRTDDTSYGTITTVFRERVVNGGKFVIGTACRKSRNLVFWLSFWSLLGQRPKVTRARRHGIPSLAPGRETSPQTGRRGRRPLQTTTDRTSVGGGVLDAPPNTDRCIAERAGDREGRPYEVI